MKNNPTVEDIASTFIRDNFAPDDRLAVVLSNKRNGAVLQRLACAESISSPDFETWLRHKNAERYEVYISMNALKPAATGRSKEEVGQIRHIYLDLDDGGTAALERLLKRKDLPPPNFLVNSSPEKWQILWKVEGFSKDQAEGLQRTLARDCGADPAATDCARVLRLPGFYNHKYTRRHFITVASLSHETYRPERFPRLPGGERALKAIGRPARISKTQDGARWSSQSERDWAYAKRALARGDQESLVIAAIANHRRFEKHNPQYYAELTVHKAAEALRIERSGAAVSRVEPER